MIARYGTVVACLVIPILALTIGHSALADVFNMPPGLTSLEFVTVGNPGNAADRRDGDVFMPGMQNVGAVPYEYRIGRYEVTVAQYVEFLNSLTLPEQYRVLSPGASGAIRSNLQDGILLSYAVDGRENSPISFVNWLDAARFVNWLNNGQGDGDLETGAYDLTGVGSRVEAPIPRAPGAQYFLPSEDEWYKAAYHHPQGQGGPSGDYWKYATGANGLLSNENLGGANYHDGDYAATGTIQPPEPWLIDPFTDVGHYVEARSFYGTFDQAGNAWEWTDTFFGELVVSRGGAWDSGPFQLSYDLRGTASPSPIIGWGRGFRVAAVVPEPSTVLILAAGGLAVLSRRRRA